MGWPVGSFRWMLHNCGKKECRSLFWRMRAAFKKAMRNGSSKQPFKFQYDPYSYALNFDDGCHHQEIREEIKAFHQQIFQEYPKNTIWIYVLWVDSQQFARVLKVELPFQRSCNYYWTY